MLTLFISAAMAVQAQVPAPTDAQCASAYALQAQHMQESGELPPPGTDPQTLTQPQRTAVAASRRMLVEGMAWTALATRTPEGRKATNAAYRALARSVAAADAAFAACSIVTVEDRLPALAQPPLPVEGAGECADAVGEVFTALRECLTLEALRAKAQGLQSKLEQGALTCRSRDQARIAWSQIGSAAAGADSVGQRYRCGGR